MSAVAGFNNHAISNTLFYKSGQLYLHAEPDGKSGKYNGCVALYGRNAPYNNGGSPIQMQTCKWIANQGGQRQQITLPGSGASSGTYEGYLDYVLTQKFCIGGPDGRLANNVNVESDECRTKYKVKYLSGPAPAPTPSPGGQTCGNVCFKDSDCLTSGGFGCTRCSSYDTGAHGTCY